MEHSLEVDLHLGIRVEIPVYEFSVCGLCGRADRGGVLKSYDVDGVFFDIVIRTFPGCVCNHCMGSIEKAWAKSGR